MCLIITLKYAVINMWIHEYQNWTDFTWDAAALSPKLAAVCYKQGRLLGRMESLGFSLKQEAYLKTITNEVVKSTAIEGEILNPGEVRSSIARRLGMNISDAIPASRDVEGIVELMLDATQQFLKPLTKERLFDWHAALFPMGSSGMRPIAAGQWRSLDVGPMQVVSGPIGRESVHFEAPSADRLDAEMSGFLSWFNQKDPLDSVVRAGIAHFWFVTIHPFEDGNGRIARAIGEMALSRADDTTNRFYSLSSQIELERKEYYVQLERQQRSSPDLTPWLDWFLSCLERAIISSDRTLDHVMFKAKLWENISKYPLNERQRMIIGRMLDESFQGYMNTSKYATLAKCSNDTALRDMQSLKAYGIFIQNPGGGRNTSYKLTNTSEPG
jgi:Fic family protein